jgi:hypothetical protein
MMQQKFASDEMEFRLRWEEHKGCNVSVRKSSMSEKRTAAGMKRNNMKIGTGVMKKCILWLEATQTR